MRVGESQSIFIKIPPFQMRFSTFHCGNVSDLSRVTCCCTMQQRTGHLAVVFVKISFFLLPLLVGAENQWPTYPHPKHTSRLCYKCPPGFYKEADCALSREDKPQYARCRQCPEGQFSQRWNTDGRCWDIIDCVKSHEEIYKNGNTAPKVCACNSTSIEDHGHCVLGISLEKHKAITSTTKSPPSCPPPSCPPPSSPPLSCIPHQIATVRTTPNSKIETTVSSVEEVSVIIGLFCGLMTSAIMNIACVIIILHKSRCSKTKKKKRSQNSHGNDSKKGDFKYLRQKESPPMGNGNIRYAVTLSECKPLPAGPPATTIIQSVTTPLLPPQPSGNEEESDDPEQQNLVKGAKKTFHSATAEHSSASQDGSSDKKRTSSFERVELNFENKTQIDGKAKPPGGEDPSSPVYNLNDLFDEACRAMETEIFKESDVDFLMRQPMKFHAEECEKITHTRTGIQKQLRAAFVLWKKKNGPEPDVRKLLTSIIQNSDGGQFDWKGIANRIALKLNIDLTEQAEPEKLDKCDRAIAICESMLRRERNMEFFRIHLALDLKAIRKLEGKKEVFVREALTLWRTQNGKNATAEELVRHLVNAKQLDVAEKICDDLGLKYPDPGAEGSVEKTTHEGPSDMRDEAHPTAWGDNSVGPTREPSPPESDSPPYLSTNPPISLSQPRGAACASKSSSHENDPNPTGQLQADSSEKKRKIDEGEYVELDHAHENPDHDGKEGRIPDSEAQANSKDEEKGRIGYIDNDSDSSNDNDTAKRKL